MNKSIKVPVQGPNGPEDIRYVEVEPGEHIVFHGEIEVPRESSDEGD